MAMKLALKVGAEAAKVEAVEGFAKYAGPTPPAGVYKAVAKNLHIKDTKAGEKQMFVTVLELEAPKGTEAAQYNGFAIFHRLTLPESMEEDYADLKIGQINRLLDAINGDQKLRQPFWGGAAVLDDKGEKILKIGTKITGGKGFKGFPVVISTKNENYARKTKVKNPKTGKDVIKTETVRTLRINDVYPATHEMPSTAPRADAEDEVILDSDVVDTDIVEEPETVESEVVVEDAPEEEVQVDEPGEEPEYVDPDGDEDGYVEEEAVVEPDPEPEAVVEPDPEPEPAPARKARRSAF